MLSAQLPLITCPRCDADLLDENCPACDGPFVELDIEVGDEPEVGVEFDVVALTEEEQALLRHSPDCTCDGCDKSLAELFEREAQAVPRSPDRLFRTGLAAMLGFDNPEAATREAVLAAVRARLKRIADLERHLGQLSSPGWPAAKPAFDRIEAILALPGADDTRRENWRSGIISGLRYAATTHRLAGDHAVAMAEEWLRCWGLGPYVQEVCRG